MPISNVYGHGFGSCEASRVEALGFRIRPEVSKYMGAQVCRFIDFERGPCLELIEVEDDQAYLDFLPEGMVAYCPGISLTVSGTGAFKDYELEFRHLRPYTLHVNYDGSSGPAGPGWTYLNFGVPVVAGTFLWLTAYDEPRPVRERILTHPNTVKGIEGLVFALDAGGLKELGHLAGAEVAGGAFAIDSVKVWSEDAARLLATDRNERDKVFPLTAMVLRAENLDYFSAHPEGTRACSFLSRPAVRIPTNRRSWDLVVVA